MWRAAPMRVDVLAATRPPGYGTSPLGLLTVRVMVPLYVWLDLGTHRRLATTLTPARSMHEPTLFGYYHPPTFFYRTKGMAVAKEVTSSRRLAVLHTKWGAAHQQMAAMWADVDKIANEVRLAKEQSSWLLPATRIVRGVLTGTESAWRDVITTYQRPTADAALHHLAGLLQRAIHTAPWRTHHVHRPYATYHNVRVAVALLSGVAYTQDSRRLDARDVQKAEQVYDTLIANASYTPFEHIAIWTKSVVNPFAWCMDDVVYCDDGRMGGTGAASGHGAADEHDAVGMHGAVDTQDARRHWYLRPFHGWLPYRLVVEPDTLYSAQQRAALVAQIEQSYQTEDV